MSRPSSPASGSSSGFLARSETARQGRLERGGRACRSGPDGRLGPLTRAPEASQTPQRAACQTPRSPCPTRRVLFRQEPVAAHSIDNAVKRAQLRPLWQNGSRPGSRGHLQSGHASLSGSRYIVALSIGCASSRFDIRFARYRRRRPPPGWMSRQPTRSRMGTNALQFRTAAARGQSSRQEAGAAGHALARMGGGMREGVAETRRRSPSLPRAGGGRGGQGRNRAGARSLRSPLGRPPHSPACLPCPPIPEIKGTRHFGCRSLQGAYSQARLPAASGTAPSCSFHGP